MSNLNELPKSDDEFWSDAEVHRNTPVPVDLCAIHFQDWTQGEYTNEAGGAVKCLKCPWGTRLPGYLRCLDGKIIDLRGVNRE